MTWAARIGVFCLAVPFVGLLAFAGCLMHGAWVYDRLERQEQERSDEAEFWAVMKAAVMAEVEADLARDSSPAALQGIWDLT